MNISSCDLRELDVTWLVGINMATKLTFGKWQSCKLLYNCITCYWSFVKCQIIVKAHINVVKYVFSGSIPTLYREIYEIVCPNQEHVDHDMFIKILVKSSLPKQTLSQVSHLISVLINVTLKKWYNLLYNRGT